MIEKILQTSLIKTLYFNYRYFGMRGGWKLPVFVSRNVRLINMKGTLICDQKSFGVISLGYGVSYKKFIWDNEGEIIFKGKAHLSAGDKVSNKGRLVFGYNFSMHINSDVISYNHIEFGDDCLVSWECLFMDTDFHKIKQNKEIVNPDKEVIIGNHVWCGCRCSIFKGATIPNDTIVAAGSIIHKQYVAPNTIITGEKILRENVIWEY